MPGWKPANGPVTVDPNLLIPLFAQPWPKLMF